MLEAEAKERQATSTGGAHPQLVQRIAPAGQGQARDQAANLLKTNPQYVSDAKRLQNEAPDLTSSQRAAISLDVLPMLEAEAKERQGARTDIQQIFAECGQGQARDQAANLLKTNRQYVSDAKRLQNEAPDLLSQVSRLYLVHRLRPPLQATLQARLDPSH
jgi:hypothetical protein